MRIADILIEGRQPAAGRHGVDSPYSTSDHIEFYTDKLYKKYASIEKDFGRTPMPVTEFKLSSDQIGVIKMNMPPTNTNVNAYKAGTLDSGIKRAEAIDAEWDALTPEKQASYKSKKAFINSKLKSMGDGSTIGDNNTHRAGEGNEAGDRTTGARTRPKTATRNKHKKAIARSDDEARAQANADASKQTAEAQAAKLKTARETQATDKMNNMSDDQKGAKMYREGWAKRRAAEKKIDSVNELLAANKKIEDSDVRAKAVEENELELTNLNKDRSKWVAQIEKYKGYRPTGKKKPEAGAAGNSADS